MGRKQGEYARKETRKGGGGGGRRRFLFALVKPLRANIYIYIAKGRERKDGRRGEKCAKVNPPFTRMIRGSSLEKRIIIRVSGEAGRTITLVKGGFVVKSVEFEFRSA